MSNLNLEQVEASLKAAKRRSQRRFLVFIALILAIWGGTYLYTKGEFTFFTKKIAVLRDTIVVEQTAAIDARDQIIADQASLITLLEDSIVKVSARIIRPTARPVRNYEAERLAEQIRLREVERKRRDSILLSRKEQFNNQYLPEIEQNTLKNIQVDPKR